MVHLRSPGDRTGDGTGKPTTQNNRGAFSARPGCGGQLADTVIEFCSRPDGPAIPCSGIFPGFPTQSSRPPARSGRGRDATPGRPARSCKPAVWPGRRTAGCQTCKLGTAPSGWNAAFTNGPRRGVSRSVQPYGNLCRTAVAAGVSPVKTQPVSHTRHGCRPAGSRPTNSWSIGTSVASIAGEWN